jgi:hypothetical protein
VEHVGIDVHKKQSQICIFTEAGEVLHQRIQTQRERFAAGDEQSRGEDGARSWEDLEQGESGWL